MFNRRTVLAGGLASAALIRFPGVSNIVHAGQGGVPSITFDVDDVERGTTALPLRPTKAVIDAVLNAPNKPVESWTQDVEQLVALNTRVHPFLAAITTAYDRHFPIILSPDMVWLQILQGLASHVNANAEKLRHHFVKHDGKVLIEIRRDGFLKGNPNNDWEGAFAEFSDKMRPHIGAQNHDLIAGKFGTTGATELAAMNVSLMDAMQSYFVYGMTTSCGFPSVTLEGSVDDWTALRDRAASLSRYDLDWWTKHLVPVLDQFVETAAGRPDKDFWCDIYKLQRAGSGSNTIHGHINVFFPYFGGKAPTRDRLIEDFEIFIRNTKMSGPYTEEQIQQKIADYTRSLEYRGPLDGKGDSYRRNPYIGRTDLARHEGMTTQDIDTKMNSAPMVWNYFGQMLQMELLAGFIGATQDPVTLAIRPKIGWAVREIL